MEKLPIELQVELLKTNPSFTRLSSRYRNDIYSQQQFVKNHCYVPISELEFKRYLQTRPVFFIMYYDMPEYEFVAEVYTLDQNRYHVIKYDLTMDNSDVDEYHFSFKEQMFKTNKSQISNLFLDDVYYDYKTTLNILKRRQCDQMIKNFSESYARKLYDELSTPYPVTDRDSLYSALKRNIYLLSQENEEIPLYTDELSQLIFNGRGQFEDQNLVHDYVENLPF